MNNKRNRNTTPVRNEAYWLGLVERFFAAQTSEAEEKELREFLLSSRGADARYDEVRAVMSFLAVGRDVHGSHTATPSRPVALPFGGNLRPSVGGVATEGECLLLGRCGCCNCLSRRVCVPRGSRRAAFRLLCLHRRRENHRR